MNWDAIGAIAELLGAVGVIASLVYLATQIRQSRDQIRRNSESVEAATALAVSEATQHRLLVLAQTPDLAEAMRKMESGDELSATERIQLGFFTRATLRGIENTFVQHGRGMIADEVWQGYESLLRNAVRSLVVQEWWPSSGRHSSPSSVSSSIAW